MGPQPEPNEYAQRLQELQLHKAALENEKLDLEIHNLKRRWPLFAPYVTGTLTVLAIATGTLITYQNSEWKRDAESARNEAKTMQGQKASLEGQIAAAQKELGTLQGQINALRTQVANARQEAAEARSQHEKLEQRARDIQGNHKKLAGADPSGKWQGSECRKHDTDRHVERLAHCTVQPSQSGSS
jgi:septal ring factor EnvC (AmiA/AmiB activator)